MSCSVVFYVYIVASQAAAVVVVCHAVVVVDAGLLGVVSEDVLEAASIASPLPRLVVSAASFPRRKNRFLS